MPDVAQLSTALAGRYTIVREIGAGGMATVFLARDERHDRNVALKVLNPELGAVLGVDRFLSEIKVTANLQHPNLLPLFDSGEANGLLFYVMPFVEGESLRARLDRERQLPVDEAIRIAAAIAGALDYAHARGVIHRDLKPENVLIQAGQPVVADFGIALAVSNAGGARVTQTGLSLGTPQYMSPEQATGDRVIDGRSDIYSLGAMLYEMLVGDPPHTASTAQALIAKVVTDTPRSVRASRPAVPEHVDAAVARALEKLPADRWETGREFADALQGRGFTMASTAFRPAGSRKPTIRERLRDPITASALAVAFVAVAAAAWSTRRPIIPTGGTARFAFGSQTGVRPVYAGTWSVVASPDGKTIVFTGTTPASQMQLFARDVDQLSARPVAGTDGAAQPMFSPDGKWIAFLADGKLKKVPIEGGAAVTLASAKSNNGGDWSPSGVIVLGAEGDHHGLMRVSAEGGTLEEFTHPNGSTTGVTHLWPVVLADGKTMLLTLYDNKSTQGSTLGIGDLVDGKVQSLGVKGMAPLGVFDGNLVYVLADGSIVAAPFDLARRRVTGPPVPVLDPVTVCRTCNGDAAVRISRNGTVAYLTGTLTTQLAWLDEHGNTTTVSSESRQYDLWRRLSPDGRSIATVVDAGPQSDIWIVDVATGTSRRLTQGGVNDYPEWSPDGKRVLFTSDRGGFAHTLWAQAADGSTPAEQLTDSMHDLGPFSIGPDGRSVVITSGGTGANSLDTLHLGTARRAIPYLTGMSNSPVPRFSPDGKWLAYATFESGAPEVYVRSFSTAGGVYPVSSGGGYMPIWSADGHHLYYASGQAIYAATVTTSPTFSVSSRQKVAEFTGNAIQAYDVAPDGKRFLVLKPDNDNIRVVVVLNWLDELRRRTQKHD